MLVVLVLLGSVPTPLVGQTDGMEWRAPRGQTCSVQPLDTDVTPTAIVDSARLDAVADAQVVTRCCYSR